MVRDFFWDDEFRFRTKWDEMILHAETMEECPTTGTMVVHWVRKVHKKISNCFFLVDFHCCVTLFSKIYFFLQFPFFCSDREYVIGRRIWESGRSYYCVTKVIILFCSLFFSFDSN